MFVQRKSDMKKNICVNQNVIIVEKIVHYQHIPKKEIIIVRINVLYHMKNNMIHTVVKMKLVQFNVQSRIARKGVKVIIIFILILTLRLIIFVGMCRNNFTMSLTILFFENEFIYILYYY